MAKEKISKMNKSGKPRKDRPSGAERIALLAQRSAETFSKVLTRSNKWADKTNDSVARDRLKTIAHLFSEAAKMMETVGEKANSLVNSNWIPTSPPKFAKNKFTVGDRVKIKPEYFEYYAQAFDKKSLENMRIEKEMNNGTRLAFLVPGIGCITKSHIERVEE